MKNPYDCTECVVISGGEISPLDDVKPNQFVIACDKGMEYALKYNITPDIFVGDFDSFHGIVPPETKIIKLPVKKDDTDTLYALKYALESGMKKISLRCALGGRVDHLFANLQCCNYVLHHNGEINIKSENTEIFFIKDGSINLKKKDNFFVSVFSLTNECSGVTIKGAEYCADNITITNTFPIGISNKWKENSIDIRCESGTLMIMITKE
ncbi:MAG: thiamine diphosphokinase [Clostridiales bacterium]|nr:thiamine diphosphokinase [Clostridiales bacterium]